MKKHDIVKLGRVKFKVNEIHIKDLEDEKQRKKIKHQLRHIKQFNIQAEDSHSALIKEESHYDKLEGEENCLEIEAILQNKPELKQPAVEEQIKENGIMMKQPVEVKSSIHKNSKNKLVIEEELKIEEIKIENEINLPM